MEELRQVRGFEGKNYDLIKPYVTALPDISTKININTAPALLLATIDPKLDLNAIVALLKQKQAKMENFNNVQDLLSLDLFKGISSENSQLANNLFDVKSNYFVGEIEVALENRNRQMSSHMMRKNNRVVVYARNLAPF